MTASLFIDRHPQGLTFYINGDLQFDTADEAIYHEYLVVPAIALAVQRFPGQPLRVLICGGGDGLAAREVLRFAAVADVALVDYSAEVVELGRTEFRSYNQESLVIDPEQPLGASRITVHIAEAFDFVSRLPDACFHAVVCDFTFPTRSCDTSIYSQEWFQQVRRILYSGGVMSTNAVSPNHRTLGFWCLYQTLLAAALAAKPLQVSIPSFQAHGYGDWGFFYASDRPIHPEEIAAIVLPPGLTYLTSAWPRAMQFPPALAATRQHVRLHTLAAPQLWYYLLNPGPIVDAEDAEDIDFLALEETAIGLVGEGDPLHLEAIAQQWLEQLHASELTDPSVPSPFRLSHVTGTDDCNWLPIHHRYHSQPMTQEWLSYAKTLLQAIDLQQLVTSLLERAKELPPQLAHDLRQIKAKLQSGEALTQISMNTAELITLVTVTLLVANLAAPDVVFAKGSYSSGSSSGDSDYYDGGYDDSGQPGWLGFWLTTMGGVWLFNLLKNRRS